MHHHAPSVHSARFVVAVRGHPMGIGGTWGLPGPVLVCDTPPPRVLRDSGLGAWSQRRPPFFSVCFLFIKSSVLLSARYRKTRRYTNVVCCEVKILYLERARRDSSSSSEGELFKDL